MPAAFGLALFCLDERGGRLELEIGVDAPPVFAVESKEQGAVLDSESWVRSGSPNTVVVPWGSKRLPSSLDVRWQDDEKREYDAPWVVNVADMSALPPPDELGSLSLAELIEILTSARPLHEVVLRILQRRENQKAPGATIEVDPHQKVDTSQFFLRRMRRVAQALEGMRERLQQPVSLAGRAPLALARADRTDRLGKASLRRRPRRRRVHDRRSCRDLAQRRVATSGDAASPQSVRGRKIMQSLHELAHEAPAAPALRNYVTTSFEELLS